MIWAGVITFTVVIAVFLAERITRPTGGGRDGSGGDGFGGWFGDSGGGDGDGGD